MEMHVWRYRSVLHGQRRLYNCSHPSHGVSIHTSVGNLAHEKMTPLYELMGCAPLTSGDARGPLRVTNDRLDAADV